MHLNNYQFLKKREVFIVISLILISIAARIPVILILGDTSLENEWGVLVKNLINYEILALKNFD